MTKRRIKNNLYICHARNNYFTSFYDKNIALIEQGIKGCQILIVCKTIE